LGRAVTSLSTRKANFFVRFFKSSWFMAAAGSQSASAIPNGKSKIANP
jgi:hypothetical protein